MFIKDWVRTLLIWGGLILFWLINAGVIGWGEPYEETVGMYIYTYQDFMPYGWFLYIIAFAFTLTGCYIWIKLKKRHWGFMFWGILTPIGLLGISLLKDKSKLEVLNADV